MVVVLLLAGVGAFLLMQKNMSQQDDEGEDGAAQASQVAESSAKPKVDPSAPPIFVPLEPFIVNLADRETERFAQIGINLQVDDAKVGDQMKLYMPAIRNAILLILSRKSAEDLLTAEGKVQLASVGNTPLTKFLHPEIITVDPGYAESGRQAAAQLIEQINGRSEPRQIVIPAHLS